MPRARSECGSMTGPSTGVVCEDADIDGFGRDYFPYVGEIH
jgi:hypothetical protein